MLKSVLLPTPAPAGGSPISYVPICTVSPKVRPTSALPDRCVFRFLTRLVFWLPTGGGFVLLFVLTDSTGEHLSRFRHRSNSFQETVPTWFNVGRYHGIGRVGIEPTSRTLIWDPAALHPIELPSDMGRPSKDRQTVVLPPWDCSVPIRSRL